MEKNKIRIEDFISHVRNEANDIPSSFSSEASQYLHVRGYSYFLGGLVLSIVEQSIILKKDNIMQTINQEWLRMDYRQQKRQHMQGFINKIKRIQQANNQLKLTEFNAELNDPIFVMGAEIWAREILISSRKFIKMEAELLKTPSTTDSFLYASLFSVVNPLSDLFKVDVVLLQLDNQTRQLSYTNFRTVKSFSVTAYVLSNVLYSCLSKTPLITQLGDGFPSEVQLKERTAEITKSQNKENDQQQTENRDRINYNPSSNQNQLSHDIRNNQDGSRTKLCNKCNKPADLKYILLNTQCGHAYCADCLLQIINLNRPYAQISCLSRSCPKSLNAQAVKTFLDNLKAEVNQNRANTAESMGKSSLIPSAQVIYQKCSSCYRTLPEKDCFKKENCHSYCCECIEKLYSNSISQYFVSCPCCGKILPKDQIAKFITQTKGSSQSSSEKAFSIPSQEKQPDSHKETIQTNKQQQQPLSELNKGICDRCKVSNLLISAMFSPDDCSHRICIDCVHNIKELCLKTRSYVQACNLLPPCSGYIKFSKIDQFLQSQDSFLDSKKEKERQIALDGMSNRIGSNSIENRNGIDNVQNEYNNRSKLSDTSNHNNISSNINSSQEYCNLCWIQYEKENLFKNLQCPHYYCLKCIEKSQSIPDLSMCQVKRCRQQLDVTGMDDFYAIQQAKQNEYSEGSKRIFDHKVVCSNCKASGTIQAAETPEYFKCTSCQKTTCLKHNVLVSTCKCFCETCGSQCRQEGKITSCTKCNWQFCSACNKADCRCGRFCEFCGNDKPGKLCNCLEKICCVCLNEFEDTQLNARKDAILRQQSSCTHSFCNPCYFKKVSRGIKLDCLFCSPT